VRLHQSATWIVERDAARAVVLLARSIVPFSSAQDIDASLAPVHRTFATIDRARHALLVDMRKAPLRNDPAYENAMAEHRRRIVAGFRACALLVNTTLGKLQLQRLSRLDGIEWAAFDDETRAIEHLTVPRK
jgi:hypothetical protein